MRKRKFLEFISIVIILTFLRQGIAWARRDFSVLRPVEAGEKLGHLPSQDLTHDAQKSYVEQLIVRAEELFASERFYEARKITKELRNLFMQDDLWKTARRCWQDPPIQQIRAFYRQLREKAGGRGSEFNRRQKKRLKKLEEQIRAALTGKALCEMPHLRELYRCVVKAVPISIRDVSGMIPAILFRRHFRAGNYTVFYTYGERRLGCDTAIYDIMAKVNSLREFVQNTGWSCSLHPKPQEKLIGQCPYFCIAYKKECKSLYLWPSKYRRKAKAFHNMLRRIPGVSVDPWSNYEDRYHYQLVAEDRVITLPKLQKLWTAVDEAINKILPQKPPYFVLSEQEIHAYMNMLHIVDEYEEESTVQIWSVSRGSGPQSGRPRIIESSI